MTIWRGIQGSVIDARADAAVVTVGNFDGVHRGHQYVLARTRETGRGLPVVAVTFDPHPLAIIAPDHAPRRLTTIERRIDLLHEHGADEVRVLDFTREMAAWSPEEFILRVVVDQLRAAHVVVGSNFRFGAKAAGDVDLLRTVGSQAGFTVEGLELDGGEQPFSSTLIRALVAEARLPEAADVLGRPHEVTGMVVEGDRRGRDLGFPTANVPVDESFAVPPDGVYAGRLITSGEALPAAISVGTNPTFGGHERRVESYIIDHGHDLDLYRQQVRVEFVERLRGMDAFDSVAALVAQMHDDVTAAREILTH
ncbi:bifunctional riboflavin kinase/FAD synthetase [Aeromicrobium sp. CTD01-1L150]|uniref:bifunctional riboflavin kinase/FAD synthetase n=1 Tax=Aeromicrobium sp. CTD01-1L150 TaxID=3341830 RepID=UPI0035C16B48